MLIRTRFSDDPFTRLFDSMFAPRPSAGIPGFGTAFPPLNVWEDGENVYCEAELPGIRMEDLELTATGEELRLKGSRKIERTENANVLRCERMSGEFDRVISLPAPIDVEKIEASLRDGILTMTMPKAASVRARRIQVNADAS